MGARALAPNWPEGQRRPLYRTRGGHAAEAVGLWRPRSIAGSCGGSSDWTRWRRPTMRRACVAEPFGGHWWHILRLVAWRDVCRWCSPAPRMRTAFAKMHARDPVPKCVPHDGRLQDPAGPECHGPQMAVWWWESSDWGHHQFSPHWNRPSWPSGWWQAR